MSEAMSGRAAGGARILLVEDDPALRIMVSYNLEKSGYTVGTAESGEEALEQMSSFRPSLVLLDWMLPGALSGMEVCRKLRAQSATRDIPIIMLTARSEEADAIRGLENGADDYLTKPCSMATLEVRIRALLRRTAGSADELLVFDDLRLDLVRHRAERAGRQLSLGPTEFRLLEFFMRQPGRVFSRDDILKAIWGAGIHVELRTVDVHIRRLRKEINAPGEKDLIRTVRSAGYAFDATPD